MCDYSLCGLPTRLAVEGEELVVHKFETRSIGLASPAELNSHKFSICGSKGFWEMCRRMIESVVNPPSATAVCVPPGACLLFRDGPEDLQRKWKIADEESAMFVQTSAQAHQYRDAILFRQGGPVSLQKLREGMRVQILSLGGNSAERDSEFTHPRYTPVGIG